MPIIEISEVIFENDGYLDANDYVSETNDDILNTKYVSEHLRKVHPLNLITIIVAQE